MSSFEFINILTAVPELSTDDAVQLSHNQVTNSKSTKLIKLQRLDKSDDVRVTICCKMFTL